VISGQKPPKRSDIAEVVILIFKLDRPVWDQHVFDAAATYFGRMALKSLYSRSAPAEVKMRLRHLRWLKSQE
jgi:hypothetical protein